MTYFPGLDLHKRSVTATTLDAEGAVVVTDGESPNGGVARQRFSSAARALSI
jgi:hypothetical protein